MTGFRKLAERELFRGTVVSVGEATFEGPGSQRFERQVVHHPGAVVVVPMLDEATVVVVRQYRSAVGAELLELPAGRRDVAGEATDATAARELAEEVGLRPGRLELMARFYNSPGFSDELSWLYRATGLTEVPRSPVGHEEQAMRLETLDLADVTTLVRQGEIVDAKTIIGLTLALDWPTDPPLGDRDG